MNFNFFEWIREGVKRSVLLGVSDAVEQMGMPHDEHASKEKILAFLQDDGRAGVAPRKRLVGASPASARKLGRSITDIHPAEG